MLLNARFSSTIKIAILIALGLFVFSLTLSYYGILGISISQPEDNTSLRSALNMFRGYSVIFAFWILVGYLCKDYKSALIALLISLALSLGLRALFPAAKSVSYTGMPPQDMKFILHSIRGMSSIVPVLVFGILHFKSSRKAFKLTLYWFIVWGLATTLSSMGFENMIESFTRIFGIKNPFEFKIYNDNGGYRPISIFRHLPSAFYIIVKLCIFWWAYQFTKSKKSIWSSLHTFSISHSLDRISYSGIYWGLIIILFVSAYGLMNSLDYIFRLPFNPISILRAVVAACAIVVTAAIYRNFLVSIFAQSGKYPGGLFIFLSIPIVNVIAWVISLLSFDFSSKGSNNYLDSERIKKLQLKFTKENRNGGWKIVLIIMTLINLVYHTNRAGFRLDAPSYEGGNMTMIIYLISFSLVLWYLYSKHAYIPLLVLCIANVLVIAIIRDRTFLNPKMTTGIVNLVVFYGLFYFDQLKWDEPEPKIAFANEEE